MSTSLLYHVFGAPGYDFISNQFEGGSLFIHMRPKDKLVRCPECKSFHVIRRGVSERKLRTLPVGAKQVWLVAEVPRVKCLNCGCLRRIHLGIADVRRSYTRRFERYLVSLTRMMTLKDVANLLNIGWDCVKDIHMRYLKRRFVPPKLSKLRYIAIDEISIKKGHKYLTIVLDLETGEVVFVGDGKGASALEPFWKSLRHSNAKILAVATDLSRAYISAVTNNLPGVPLVFDHFHVVKLMNDALTEVRRSVYRESSEEGRKVLKGSRWILLKNPEHLRKDDKVDEAKQLQAALDLNKPLSIAYYMKEDLRRIWSQTSKESAEAILTSWIIRAKTSNIKALMRVGKTLEEYSYGLLNWYDHHITSGPMEGTNNKIKTMKKMAYGYSDVEFFKLRILGIHEAKFAMTG